MVSVETRKLGAAVALAVARSLGDDVDLPVLDDTRLEDPEVVAEIAVTASYHRVLPMLWAAIEDSAAPEALRRRIHDSYLELAARELRLRNLLQLASQALTNSGLDFAVYKGPAVARHYPARALRPSGDIDVLVRLEAVQAVDRALGEVGIGGGWASVPDGWAEAMYTHGAVPLDVHWHLMREPPQRAAFDLDTTAMLARVQRATVYDLDTFVLDDADHFIAVAMHACFDGAYRLGWLVDIAQLMRAPGFNWSAIRNRCALTGTALPVQVIVDRAVRTLDVAEPGAPLARGAWRQLMRGVSAARPVERSFRQAGRGGLVFRSTRPTTGASARTLAHSVVTEGLVPLIKDPDHRWRRAKNARI